MNLKTLHLLLTKRQRAALAKAAGIAPVYLYQMAIGFRRNPSLRQCAGMVNHDSRLKYKDLAVEFAATPADTPTDLS